MAQEPLFQRKIGFTQTEIDKIERWQDERGLNSFSAAARDLAMRALNDSRKNSAARIGEAGMAINDLILITGGRKTAMSKRQVNELVQRHCDALMGLRLFG